MLPSPSAMAAPMATAMATIAHTVDSSPELMPGQDRGGRAGAGADSAISCTGCGLGRGEVLGEPAHDLGEHEPDDDGAEAPSSPRCRGRCRRRRAPRASVPITVRTLAVRKPRLIGAIARLVLVGGPHREHADDRREHADGAGGEREDEAERGVGADRVERGDAEDDRRDQRDLVALEQVGGHPGAVADVVAHVVGDRGRVAGVVLGDALLDLADEVGADVGRLGEDAAADPHEQREQRPAEPEADEDRRRGVLEDHDDHGGAEQAEADREHAGDAAGAERDLERGRQRARAWPRRRCGRCRAPRGSCR